MYIVERRTGLTWAALTPFTPDYWEARRWVARFLRDARRIGLRVRPVLIWPGERESRLKFQWAVFDGAERKEFWRIVRRSEI